MTALSFQKYLSLQRCLAAAVIWWVFVAFASNAHAHEIPTDITIQVFVKPDANGLHVLLRLPLKAAGDVDLPLTGVGYLDFSRANPSLREAAAVFVAPAMQMYENGVPLSPRVAAVQASFESDRSFLSYDEALQHVTGPPLLKETKLYWDQAMLDMLLEYPIESERSQFSIHPAVGELGLHVVTALQFLPPMGVPRALEFVDDPGVIVLDPTWHKAVLQFVKLGFLHILSGKDHLLFLICLVIPFRRWRTLIPIATSFTFAHSITLIASAYGFIPQALWFAPLIETMIASSIVYMALENILGVAKVRRWVITFAFGLIHGFGFSFALRSALQFAGSHLLMSLLSFNVGVELGQVVVLVLILPALEVLFRSGVAERTGTIIISAFVAHTGWHWLIDRGEQLLQFQFTLPLLTVRLIVSAMRWALVVMIVVSGIWVAKKVMTQRAARSALRKQTIFVGEDRPERPLRP